MHIEYGSFNVVFFCSSFLANDAKKEPTKQRTDNSNLISKNFFELDDEQISTDGFDDTVTPKKAVEKNYNDIFIWYSCLEGYASNRHVYKGTPFIECLATVMSKCSCKMDVAAMANEVKDLMIKHKYSNGQSDSKVYLTKALYLDVT